MQQDWDPSRIWSFLNTNQSQALQGYIILKEQEASSEMNQWISEELKKMDIDRLVVPYFRVSICDYSGSSMDDRCKATLTMWRPDENLYSNIKEGGRYLPMCIVFFKNLRYRKCEFEFGVHFLATNPETEIKVSPREIYAQETITDLKQWVKNNKPTLDELQSTAVEICGPLLDEIYYLK
ncbi:hypothetical protein G9A89_021433 [Geosiphon pyriformis]|nr:hypothetical protein G9A89_021433 [Geosiphon pyriformis]